MAALTFAQALLQAEAQARATLDARLHERLSCAVSLVKDGRVFQTGAGLWEVDSASTKGLVYSINGTCNCHDVHFNHPPKGLCKHKIAIALAKRAQQLLAAPPAPVVPALQAPPPAPLPPPLPEAPASVNVRLTIGGREVQLTLRDHDEVRLLVRLEDVLQRFPVAEKSAAADHKSPPQPNAAAMHKRVSDFCPVHNVQMKRHENAKGVWYSHYYEGKHCKGR